MNTSLSKLSGNGLGLLVVVISVWVVRPAAAQGTEGARRNPGIERTNATKHPLAAPLQWAQHAAVKLDTEIRDYTCTLVKRENGGEEHIYLKVRQKPFSLYARFLSPTKVKGREILYVAGKNGDRFLAHEGRGIASLIGTVKLKPSDKYPIHKLGIGYLNEALIGLAKKEIQTETGQATTCKVKHFPNCKVGEEDCYCIELSHPIRHAAAGFPLARVFWNKQWGVPFRYQEFKWPERAGAPPVLDKDFCYLNLKINVGLTDRDFDRRNSDYSF